MNTPKKEIDKNKQTEETKDLLVELYELESNSSPMVGNLKKKKGKAQ